MVERQQMSNFERSCILVVPAYNEANRISQCLDTLVRSDIPEGFLWSEWIVLDGASDDGTAEIAEKWAAENKYASFRVISSSVRRGITADFADFQRYILDDRYDDFIVVVVEADTEVRSNTLSELLMPFRNNPRLAATFGSCLADDRSWGRWASTFQLEATERLSKLLGSNRSRAMGRIFAYSVGILRGFVWQPGCGGHDAQLDAFLKLRNLPAMSISSACVMTMPARGYQDFFLQTDRIFASMAATKACFGQSTDFDYMECSVSMRYRAFLKSALRDPLRASAYLIARAMCLIWQKTRRREFVEAWATSSSTKQARSLGR